MMITNLGLAPSFGAIPDIYFSSSKNMNPNGPDFQLKDDVLKTM